jgi:homoserine kinase
MEMKVRVPATTANLGPGFDVFGAALSRYLSKSTQELKKGEEV